MYNILLVDDDREYIDTIKLAIATPGYRIVTEYNPIEALSRFTRESYDLVVTDYKMENIDGLRLIKTMKEIRPTVKIIMLTGYQAEDIEHIALNLKVDFFLSKEKSLEMINHYVLRILRDESSRKEETLFCSEAEGITADSKGYDVYKGERHIELTKKEFEVLLHFLRHKNRAFSRDEIIAELWTTEIEEIDPRVIDVHIRRIREKLQISSLVSIRGVGYKWNE
ncbi:two-component system alkaline phosphatase synthesis response regulator PhoP [Lachnospiraceae bacterium PF1-21]|uniref:response regulator transcription factor n=1 Tax=Ohessyouella blattaphilus TaxID=2949333 RepID=UPI0025678560|nr:response regulator transcription factor [Lachnospiraceae bacterium OttesenSCG-928-J05]